MNKKIVYTIKVLKDGKYSEKCGCCTSCACKCISVSVRVQTLSLLFVVGCDRGWKIKCSFTKGAATRE